MPQINEAIRINTNPENVWATLADLSLVSEFNAGVKHAHYTTTQRAGVGAGRHCDLTPFGSVEEVVVDWDDGRSMTIEIIDGTKIPPITNAKARFTVREAGSGTIVEAKIDYQMKFGVLGSILNAVLVQPRFEGVFREMLRGLKSYTQRNEAQNPPATEPATQHLALHSQV